MTMATGKPTSSASAARRARSACRRTSATASAASGPNSGPTTIAPTTVTGESVTTPTAAIRHASDRNIRKVTLSVESSRVRATSSSQTTASAGSPSARSSARWARVDSTVSSDVQRDRPAFLHAQCLELLDDVVGGLPGDVGGDLVAAWVQGGVAVHHQVRDARIARQGVDHRIAQLGRCDDP